MVVPYVVRVKFSGLHPVPVLCFVFEVKPISKISGFVATLPV